MTAQPRTTFIEPDLVSLAGYTLSELRTDRSPELLEAVQQVLRQVERPRANLGGSGPPGRAD